MMRFIVFILFVLVVVGIYPALLLSRSKHSQLRIDPVPKAIGLSTPLKLHVENPHGVRKTTVWLEQNGAQEKVFEAVKPAHWLAWSVHEPAQDLAFTAVGNSSCTTRSRTALPMSQTLRPPEMATNTSRQVAMLMVSFCCIDSLR